MNLSLCDIDVAMPNGEVGCYVGLLVADFHEAMALAYRLATTDNVRVTAIRMISAEQELNDILDAGQGNYL